jgi:hypothetical protein
MNDRGEGRERLTLTDMVAGTARGPTRGLGPPGLADRSVSEEAEAACAEATSGWPCCGP